MIDPYSDDPQNVQDLFALAALNDYRLFWTITSIAPARSFSDRATRFSTLKKRFWQFRNPGKSINERADENSYERNGPVDEDLRNEIRKILIDDYERNNLPKHPQTVSQVLRNEAQKLFREVDVDVLADAIDSDNYASAAAVQAVQERANPGVVKIAGQLAQGLAETNTVDEWLAQRQKDMEVAVGVMVSNVTDELNAK